MTALADVATAIQTAVQALTKLKTSTDPAAFTGFTCTVDIIDRAAPRLILTSGTTSATSSVLIAPALDQRRDRTTAAWPGNGGMSEDGLAVRRPAAGGCGADRRLGGGSSGDGRESRFRRHQRGQRDHVQQRLFPAGQASPISAC